MTGYFARLAARTGLGSEGLRPASRDEGQLLEQEETVTVFAQPQWLPEATEAPSGTAAARNSGPVAPLSVSAPIEDTAQPKTKDEPDKARLELLHPRPSRLASVPVERLIEAAPRRVADVGRPPDASLALRGHPKPSAPRAAIAGPARSADPLPRAVDQPPAFNGAERADSVEPVQPFGPTPAERAVVAPVAAPRATPTFRSAQLVRTHHTTVREPATLRSSDRVQPLQQPAPTVRIGSIQVDVHAAPPQPAAQPAQQSAMPMPQPGRAPSLRRFYLRGW